MDPDRVTEIIKNCILSFDQHIKESYENVVLSDLDCKTRNDAIEILESLEACVLNAARIYKHELLPAVNSNKKHEASHIGLKILSIFRFVDDESILFDTNFKQNTFKIFIPEGTVVH